MNVPAPPTDPIDAALSAAEAEARSMPPPEPPPEPPLVEAQPEGPDAPDDAIVMSICPVTALGHKEGKYFFIDSIGQFRAFSGSQVGVATSQADLFLGDVAWLEGNYRIEKPQKGREAWNKTLVHQYLLQACQKAGVFDPERHMRGVGVWPLGDKPRCGCDLVIHLGNRVFVYSYGPDGAKGIEHPAGVRLGKWVYVSKPPVDMAKMDAASPEAGRDVMEFFLSWNWEEAELSPRLLLGWLAIAKLTGVAPRRPVLYLVGETGCGKSELMETIKGLLGPMAMKFDDITVARLRDVLRLNHKASPVILDEAENTEDNARLQDLIELFRGTFTWGQGSVGRGGNDGYDAVLHTAGLFGAMQPPPLAAQDANRSARIHLKAIVADVETLSTFAGRQEAIIEHGPAMFRRMLKRWPDYWAAFDVYRVALVKAGHDPRSADTYASLLAGADQLLMDEPAPENDINHWIGLLPATEKDEKDTLAQRCWTHLLSTKPNAWGSGRKKTVGELLVDGMENYIKVEDMALAELKSHGITVSMPGNKPAHSSDDFDARAVIAVHPSHAETRKLFAASQWASGGWVDALGQLPGARIDKRGVVRFGGGVFSRACAKIPMALFKSGLEPLRPVAEEMEP